jgi:toxin FitB
VSGFLIDTNVLSELRKGRRAAPAVLAWFETVPEEGAFVSVLSLGEIRRGIEQARRRQAANVQSLERWFTLLQQDWSERILPIDPSVADVWGRFEAFGRLPIVDALLAATAIARDLVLATRNVKDVAPTGVRFVDPFARA